MASRKVDDPSANGLFSHPGLFLLLLLAQVRKELTHPSCTSKDSCFVAALFVYERDWLLKHVSFPGKAPTPMCPNRF